MSALPVEDLNGLFRQVTERFGDTVIAKVDRHGVVRYLNPLGLRLIGHSSAQLPVGLRWRDCVQKPHHIAILKALVRNAPDHHESVFDVQLRLNTVPGARAQATDALAARWYRCRVLRAESSSEEGAYWIIRLVDIGHRKLTEEQLRIASERLEHAVGASSVLLFAQDLSLRYIWFNRQFVGWSTAQVLGCTDAELFPGQAGGSRLHERKREVLRTGIGWREEVALSYEGTTHYLDISASAARDSHGQITGLVGAAFDVTPIRHAEQTLRDADKRKDMHLAMMAHELRNPLAPLRAIHELLRTRGNEPTLSASEVALLGRQIKHLTRVVDDLLDLSRLNQASLKLVCRPTDLRDILKDVALAADLSARERGLSLQLHVPDTPLIIDADGSRIGQVMSNLLQNAFKFTEAPGQVIVRAWASEQQVCVSVKDSGVGIARENLLRIFSPYSQVDQPDARAPVGLGLGLHLAREIMQLHGGRLEALSAGLGHGSEFTLTLPGMTDAVLPPPAIQQRLNLPDARVKRVLVVDDNVDAAETLTLMIQAWGHEAFAAFDGTEGLRQAGHLQPEVVILDLLMPGISGFDVARQIRSQPWGKRALLVSLSGLNREIDLHLASKAGFDVNLTKPADPQRVRTLIEDL